MRKNSANLSVKLYVKFKIIDNAFNKYTTRFEKMTTHICLQVYVVVQFYMQFRIAYIMLFMVTVIINDSSRWVLSCQYKNNFILFNELQADVNYQLQYNIHELIVFSTDANDEHSS